MTKKLAKEILFTQMGPRRVCQIIGVDYETIKNKEVDEEYSKKCFIMYAEAFEVGVKQKVIENKPWNMRAKNYVDTVGAEPGDVVVEDDMVMAWTGHLSQGYEVLYIR